MDYKPVKKRHVSASEQTNKLLKRKRVLEFTTATAAEWRKLADDFSADGGRANHAYCIMQYRKCGGKIEPVEIAYVPEPELPDDYTDI